MGLMTAEQYRESLDDGRVVYYLGEKVANVATHKHLSSCTNTMAVDYEIGEDPKYRDLALVEDPDMGGLVSRYYHKPINSEDLLKVHELIVTSTNVSDGFIPLAHDIGADALNAFAITAKAVGNQDYIDRVENYRRHLKKNDLATCAAVTDVKGDRLLRPSDPGQNHPDYYVHKVGETKEGIIVRGAKMHITGAAYAHDILAVPCRAMAKGDQDYAVAFSIPANTKGITQVCRPFKSHISDLEFPNTRPVRVHTDSLIIFDDVLVPWDRVFLNGETKFAASIAYNFARLHRRTGCAYRIPMSEQLLGVAAAIAEYNGVARTAHVKEKLTDILIYLETLKALTKAASLDPMMISDIAVPNPIITNIAKYHFAHGYHEVVKNVQDLAGGILATAPSYKDYQVPELTGAIDKYLSVTKGVTAETRLRMLDLIRRFTPSEYEVMCLHGEGSPVAERMTIYAEGQQVIAECKEMVEELAQIKK